MASQQSSTELLYPFYLDTDMTMAFAAALTGGVALKTEDVDSLEKKTEKAAELRAGIRLFDLLDLGTRGKKSRIEKKAKSQSRMVQHHTEASIFITLFNELKRHGSIVPPDIERLETGS